MHRCSILIICIILLTFLLYKYVTIKMQSRQIWIDHISFTREYLLAVAHQQLLDGITNRLMKNQEQIGGFLGRFYGKDFGIKVADLLKQHIGLVAKVANGDKSSVTPMYDNGDQIADLLAISRQHMKNHLDLTVNEFTQITADILAGTDANFSNYDKVYRAVIMMSDQIVKNISFLPWKLFC